MKRALSKSAIRDAEVLANEALSSPHVGLLEKLLATQLLIQINAGGSNATFHADNRRLTIKQAAAELNRSEAVVRELISDGKLSYEQGDENETRFVSMEAIRQYRASITRGGQAAA